ncbi:MAG TPA: PP2C family serine/threonine-protein phosphatase [Acidimicrobiales bacterium]|nr:PP2C family serine/threonine-protein phosphatase [Acidimicrobiales bacterium]
MLRSGSASDVGRVRTINEDRILESPTLFAVADGMGGHVGGEVAAKIAIETLERGFTRAATMDGLVGAVEDANLAVWERGVGDQALRGMGTTVTAAALVATGEGDRMVLVNVGDSRAYRFHQGDLYQLSVDHSVAEELVARGELSESEAAVHPHRHILTRALGIGPEVNVDAWQVIPEEGDRYLLCSDGLSNEVLPDAIADVLASVREPRAAAEALVGLANDAGGSDNITAIVVDVLIGDPVAGDGSQEAAAAAPAADEPAGSVTTVPEPLAPAPAEAPPVAGEDGARAAVAESEAPAPASQPPTAEEPPSRRTGPRRITFRVLFFLLLLVGLAVAAFLVIRFFVTDSYYVGLKSHEIVIFQGRPGGFLGIEPKVVRRTGVTTEQVGSLYLPALRAGVQEPTEAAADRYVSGLVAAECSLESPPASCASTTTTSTTAPPPATTVPSKEP